MAADHEVEARHDYPLDSLRHGEFASGLGDSVVAVLTDDETEVEQGLRHFFDEKGYAFGLLHQSGPEFPWKKVAAKKTRRHFKRLLVGQMA
jgi:hypothetical protein